MKRGMSSLAAPQSAITQTTVGPNLLQSVWRNVNKSGSLPLSLSVPPSSTISICSPSSDEEKITRSAAHSGRRPSRGRASERASERVRRPNWPKFAEGNTFATDRELCPMRYVCRPTKVGVLGTVWEDWIVVKCCFHPLCLWIFPLETTPFPSSFSPRRLLGGRRPPKRAPRPPSPKAQARH